MAIQTNKQLLLFQLRAYHGYSEDDLKGLTIKQLKPLMNGNKGDKK